MSRNQPRTPPDRSRFLHPPPDLRAPLEDPETLRLLEQAEDRLQQFLPWKEENFHPRNQLIWTEAQASSHIEEEYGQGRIARHRQALAAFLQKPLGAQTLLQMHRTMMAGQLHAQPGQYRTIGILIGQYQPPRHPYLPCLIDGLYHYIQNSQDRPIIKAAWTHPSLRRRKRPHRKGRHQPDTRLSPTPERSHPKPPPNLLPASGRRKLGRLPRLVRERSWRAMPCLSLFGSRLELKIDKTKNPEPVKQS